MKKNVVNIRLRDDAVAIARDENVERRRVNIIIDKDIHVQAVKLAEGLRLDFSTLVNLMLEAALSAEEQNNMVESMFATMLRRTGFIVSRNPDGVKDKKAHNEQSQKKKK